MPFVSIVIWWVNYEFGVFETHYLKVTPNASVESSLFLYCKSDIEAFQYYFILNGAIFLKVHFSYERHFVLDCLN